MMMSSMLVSSDHRGPKCLVCSQTLLSAHNSTSCFGTEAIVHDSNCNPRHNPVNVLSPSIPTIIEASYSCNSGHGSGWIKLTSKSESIPPCTYSTAYLKKSVLRIGVG